MYHTLSTASAKASTSSWTMVSSALFPLCWCKAIQTLLSSSAYAAWMFSCWIDTYWPSSMAWRRDSQFAKLPEENFSVISYFLRDHLYASKISHKHPNHLQQVRPQNMPVSGLLRNIHMNEVHKLGLMMAVYGNAWDWVSDSHTGKLGNVQECLRECLWECLQECWGLLGNGHGIAREWTWEC